eukprot:jgi/Mesvir1/23322/Mv21018-RA.1
MGNPVVNVILFTVSAFVIVSVVINLVGGKIASGICSMFGKEGDDKCKENVNNILDVIAFPIAAAFALFAVRTKWKRYSDDRKATKKAFSGPKTDPKSKADT